MRSIRLSKIRETKKLILRQAPARNASRSDAVAQSEEGMLGHCALSRRIGKRGGAQRRRNRPHQSPFDALNACSGQASH